MKIFLLGLWFWASVAVAWYVGGLIAAAAVLFGTWAGWSAREHALREQLELLEIKRKTLAIFSGEGKE